LVFFLDHTDFRLDPIDPCSPGFGYRVFFPSLQTHFSPPVSLLSRFNNLHPLFLLHAYCVPLPVFSPLLFFSPFIPVTQVFPCLPPPWFAWQHVGFFLKFPFPQQPHGRLHPYFHLCALGNPPWLSHFLAFSIWRLFKSSKRVRFALTPLFFSFGLRCQIVYPLPPRSPASLSRFSQMSVLNAYATRPF